MKFVFASVVSLLLALPLQAETYRIPPVKDASAATVAAAGFRVAIMADDRGNLPSVATFSPQLHLAWTDKELLVLAVVKDTTPFEANSVETLWQRDSIELFLATTSKGQGDPDNLFQVVIAPGRTAANKSPRVFYNDRRSKERQATPLACEATADIKGDNYSLVARIPFANLGIIPKPGVTLAFQAYINDAVAENGRRQQVLFYPKPGAHTNPALMHTLTLADTADAPVRVLARGVYDRFRRTLVTATADAALIGQTATLQFAGKPLDAAFSENNGYAEASFRLPLPEIEHPTLIVNAPKSSPATVPPLGSFALAKARTLAEENIRFLPCVFSGENFPAADFEQETRVDLLIGPYTLKTEYFDAAALPVTRAVKPGRYGAVVSVLVDKKVVTRRFATLYRMNKGFFWWGADFSPTLQLPEAFELNTAQAQRRLLGDYLNREITDSIWQSDRFAATLAAVQENGDVPADFFHNTHVRDRDYWVKVRQQIHGINTPRISYVDAAKPPAPVLKPATTPRPELQSQLDAHFKKWADDSKVPFNVAIAQNAEIVFSGAYGQRNGKPVTETDIFETASVTKAFSAVAVMMAIDRGRMKLDEPLADCLPGYDDAVSKKTTVRMLLNHTAGFEGHWGEEFVDLDDRLTAVVPHLQPATRHEYNGTSIALATRILEFHTRTSLPTFYKDYIFTPLNMPRTEGAFASYGIKSNALELAAFAQMLLNGGSYGDKRLLSPESVKAMYPQKLTAILGPDTRAEWGIGLTWRDKERTFLGHGSATSCTLWFDPDKKLVITMSRPEGGKDWGKYHDEMVKIIRTQLK